MVNKLTSVPKLKTEFVLINALCLSFRLFPGDAAPANQCYSRFWKQYDLCQQCVDAVSEAALSARVELRGNEKTLRRALRLLNAAHVFGYVGLRTGYDMDNLFSPFNAQYQILSETEVGKLR